MSIIFRFFIVLVLFLNSYRSVLSIYLDPVGYNGICPEPNKCMWFWKDCDSGFTATSSFPQCNSVLGQVCCVKDIPTYTCSLGGGTCSHNTDTCVNNGGHVNEELTCDNGGVCCMGYGDVNQIVCSDNDKCKGWYGDCYICQDPGTSLSKCVANKVNGGWSSGWTSCSDCKKYKLCNNPVPKCGGNDCSGSLPIESCGSSVGAEGKCGSPNGVDECFYNRTYPTCDNGNVNIIDDGSSGDSWADWTCSGTGGACAGGNGETVGCSHHVAYTIDGGWSNWSDCDVGTCSRSRNCDNPSPVCSNNYCGTGTVNPIQTEHCGNTDGVCATVADSCGKPTGNLCSVGNPSWMDGAGDDGTFNWNCNGICGGAVAGCSSVHLPDIIGTCGSSYPQSLSYKVVQEKPITGLCDSSTSIVGPTLYGGNLWIWTCKGQCDGASANCYATQDTPPSYTGFEIQNINGSPVVYDGSGRSHICQTEFTGTSSPNTARFVVTFSDAQGVDDIKNIQLTIGSKTYVKNYSEFSFSGYNAIATFDVEENSGNSWIQVKAEDSHSDVFSSPITTSRYFKFWDCKVSVNGMVYDMSGVTPTCYNSVGFSEPIKSTVNFKALTFNSTSGDDSKTMTVNSPYYGNSDSNKLTWGKTYEYVFNSDILMDVDPNRMKMRLNNGGACVAKSFDLNTANANPYNSTVNIKVDFTGIVDQEPWWRVKNGGAVSNVSINNQVPVTCTENCQTSIESEGNIFSKSGFVSSDEIDNSGRDESLVYPWHFYGGYKGFSAKMANSNYGYDYFYSQYLIKNKIGIYYPSSKNISDIGATGIYFIDGSLIINQNKEININSNDFLMLIVKNDITVTSNVTRVDGILVARNIGVGGSTTNNPITFNGSLYATDKITLSRGFLTKRNNNADPAVNFNYVPRMMFNFPGALSKAVTSWQWGN